MHVTSTKSLRKAEGTRFLRLGPEDASAVLALYSKVYARAPNGHLARRGATAIRRLLSDGSAGLGIGAWSESDERLKAYSLCKKAEGPTYPGAPILAGLGTDLWVGHGTVVDQTHEGRFLMARLLTARTAALKSIGAIHSAGLIAIENTASLAAALRAGGRIVGLEHDDNCLNFVCYGGPLVSGGTFGGEIEVIPNDAARIEQLIESRYIGTALRRKKSGERMIAMERLA